MNMVFVWNPAKCLRFQCQPRHPIPRHPPAYSIRVGCRICRLCAPTQSLPASSNVTNLRCVLRSRPHTTVSTLPLFRHVLAGRRGVRAGEWVWYAHDDRNSVTRVAERAIWASRQQQSRLCKIWNWEKGESCPKRRAKHTRCRSSAPPHQITTVYTLETHILFDTLLFSRMLTCLANAPLKYTSYNTPSQSAWQFFCESWLFLLAVQNSSIGDLVTHWLTD